VRIRIARKSLERVKRRIRQLTRRNQGRSWNEIKTRLETYIIGWVNYYALADALKHMTRLDGWLRRRMRQLAWKQWKTPKNRRRNLRKHGVSEYWAKRVGGSSLGPWRLSMSPPVKQALSIAYWQRVGLPSFKTQYQLRHT
jgi:hypothetical protein